MSEMLNADMMTAARRAKAASEAALHGKATDPKDWIMKHQLAAKAFDDALGKRPNDPKVALARGIAEHHRRAARLIGEWDSRKTPELQQQILVTQHAIATGLAELKKP